MSHTGKRRSDPDDVALRVAQLTDEHAIGRLGALLVRLHHYYDPQRFIAATPETERGCGEYGHRSSASRRCSCWWPSSPAL